MAEHTTTSGQASLPLLDDEFAMEIRLKLAEHDLEDHQRAKALHMIGGQFLVEFDRSHQLSALDHAVAFERDAIEALPQGHDKAAEYATILGFLLQKRLDITQSIEDANSHVEALELKVELAKGHPLYKSGLHDLGNGYVRRYMITTDLKDLDLAIETFYKCIEWSESTEMATGMGIGQALHARFLRTKSIDDANRGIKFEQDAINALPDDHPRRSDALASLARSLQARYAETCELDDLDLIISTTSVAIRASNDPSFRAALEPSLINATMRRLFHKKHSASELEATLGIFKREASRSTDLAKGVDGSAMLEEPTTATGPENRNQAPKHPALLVPLLSGARAIRLLHLHPGEIGESIHCSLEAVSLDNNPTYEALSWVWGNPNITKTIIVNQVPCDVPENLVPALLRLRSASSIRVLWVDALCINQKDLEEKSRQVRIMQHIYKSATEVAMWLGEPEPEELDLFKPESSSTQFSQEARTSENSTSMSTDDEIASTQSHPALKDSSLTGPSSDQFLNQTHGGPRDSSAKSSLQELSPSDREALAAQIYQVKGLLFGSKPAAAVAYHSLSPAAVSAWRHILKQIDYQTKFGTVLQYARSEIFDQETVSCFDWSKPELIASYLSSPGRGWPILGAFCILYCLANKQHFHQLPFFSPDEELNEELSFSSSPAWMKSASALVDIFNLRYWKRTWIVQEIVLAPKAKMYYGPHIIPFDMIAKAQKFFSVHYNFCCAKWGQKAHQRQNTWWTKIHTGFSTIEKIMRLREGHYTLSDGNELKPITIRNLLQSGIASRQATDLRDYVYGILGLVTEAGKEPIVPDYSLSVQQVFTQTAAKIIHDEDSLNFLGLNTLGHDKSLGFPSWVPDWSVRGLFCPQPYTDWLFQASGKRSCYSEYQKDLFLKIKTLRVDTVLTIGDVRTWEWQQPKKLVSLLHEWRRIADLDSTKSTQNSRVQLEASFWRTVFADTSAEDEDAKRRLTTEDIVKITNWWEWLQQEATTSTAMEWNSLRSFPHTDGFHKITNMFWAPTESRKFFVSTNSRFGTGPASIKETVGENDIQVGDEIHVALGSRVPFVLRPVNPSTDGDPMASVELQESSDDLEKDYGQLSLNPEPSLKRYALIGTCYLHGIMDGEILQDQNLMLQNILLC